MPGDLVNPVLTLEPARADDATAAGLQPVFATNTAYLQAAGEIGPGQTEISPTHAADYLAEETADPASRCLTLYDGDRAVIGTTALLVPHPREPYPWIGLLLIRGDLHSRGYGAAAADLVTHELAREAGRRSASACSTPTPARSRSGGATGSP
jgi:acetyltransferase (GNAT) family protein